MSDNQEKRSDADRLGELKAELFKRFGKLTRWRALCQERDITAVDAQIRLAEEVLAAPSTGTVAEWLTYHLRLQGQKSFDVDAMLAGGAAPGKDGARAGRSCQGWVSRNGWSKRPLHWRAITRAASS